jgi:Ca-activated chloride channel family protein
MKRPERQFWIYVSLMTSVFLLMVGGPLLSCAEAKHPHSQPSRHHPQPVPDEVAPWNQPGPSITAKPVVTLKAQLDRGAVLRGSDGTVRVEVNLETGAEPNEFQRQDSDIVVVVDTSGSMEGEKLHFARQAILSLIDRLTPGDRFGLVEYSDGAQILTTLAHPTGEQRDRFRNLAYSLQATGSTNMSEGLDRGAELLREGRSLGRPGRLLLLSDGLANAGDSTLSGLTSRAMRLTHDGFALSTMGIGEDFDENVMTSLATSGTGAFYYLTRLGYLPEFFEAELNSARNTYARMAELRFVPAPGVHFKEAMGLPLTRQGSSTVVQLGNLYSSRTRTVWVTLRVPTYRLGETALGRLSLSYHKGGDENVVSVGALPAVACLDNPHLYEQRIHRNVWERALIDDVFTKTEEDFGDAIRTGNRHDLEGALNRAEEERDLAERIGSPKIVAHLDELKSKAASAAVAQQAPAKERNQRAKTSKASGYQKRNKDNYDNSELAAEAY